MNRFTGSILALLLAVAVASPLCPATAATEAVTANAEGTAANADSTCQDTAVVLGTGVTADTTGPDTATVAAPAPPAAAVSPSGPTEFLRARDAEIQRILAEAPGDSLSGPLRTRLKEQINAAFDFRELSRLALGTNWEGRAEAEREHFVRTFSGIVQERNFDSFVRYYREGRFNYREEKVEGKKAEVRAAVPLKKEEVSVTYRLHLVNGQWRVYDLVIDDVSTAEGNRRQYARYLEKNPYEKLIDQLDRQLARLLNAGG
ncbi:MAG: ABC transporter substrate-binding protein [Candidatus Latescibacterota bacterium]|jgi:phospholipid transport system substrate-binding protein